MIRTLLWKEYREHRPLWLAMAALSAILIVGLWQGLNPTGTVPERSAKLDSLMLVAYIIALSYGLVCGAMMLADEWESGTLSFLDSLTGRRRRVWTTKMVVGLILTAGQALVLVGLLQYVGVPQAFRQEFHWNWELPGGALLAFAWGLLGSALGRSVLSAAGLGLALFPVFWLSLALVSSILVPASPAWEVQMALLGCLGFLALGGSWLIFCRGDLGRLPVATIRTRRRATRQPLISSFQVLWWLTWRQGWKMVLVLGMAAVAVGLLLHVDYLALWPFATLLVGILCGTMAYANEQGEGAFRFLGDQRLPLGQVWVMKTVFWLTMALAGAGVILGLALVQLEFLDKPHHSVDSGPEASWLDRLWGTQGLIGYAGCGIFLTLWPVYGFAIGQFFAFLWRKSGVAALVALIVSVLVLSLWLPSLVMGGLAAWQVFLAPVCLLAATRLTIWAWASNRLLTGKPALALAGFSALALAGVAGNLWFRAIEVPDVGEPFNLKAFEASLPSPENNEAGRLLRQAARELTEQEQRVVKELVSSRNLIELSRKQELSEETSILSRFLNQVQEVLDQGWPEQNKDVELGRWLDRMFEGEWVHQVERTVNLPVGMIEDPRTLNYFSTFQNVDGFRRAGDLLCARALQLQARGQNEAALKHLAAVLALSANLRHDSVAVSYLSGVGLEGRALSTLALWRERLGPQPKLPRRALEELNRHEARLPPFSDLLKTECLVIHNTVTNPAVWLAHGKSYPRFSNPLEAGLVAAGLQTPWEAQRQMRILNLYFTGLFQAAEHPDWQRAGPRSYEPLWLPPSTGPGAGLTQQQVDRFIRESWAEQFFYYWPSRLLVTDTISSCRLRGARLTLALALYRIQEGKPAQALADLVPRYLVDLPADPFTCQSFHYRVSHGERLPWSFYPPSIQQQTYKDVAAGQGIVWSSGPFGLDDPAEQQMVKSARMSYRPADFVFLVPQWAGH